MNRAFSLATPLLFTLALSGCVIIDSDHVDKDDWRETQRVNRETISQLELGLSRTAVLDKLGAPFDSEAFTDGDDEVRVLFYRTRHAKSDGETTRDETTPVVFRNGRLVGWGDAVYSSLR